MSHPEKSISVTVTCAMADRHYTGSFTMPSGATVADVLARYSSDLATPEWALPAGPVGIFGKVVRGDDCPVDGDRIEIYRSLSADPKLARRRKAVRK